MVKKKDVPAVFIDANVFLCALKEPSKNLIDQFSKLDRRLGQKEFVLYKTEQLILELLRNEEEQRNVPDDLKCVSDHYTNQDDAKAVRVLLDEVNKRRQAQYKKSLKELKLAIDSLLDKALLLKTGDDIVNKAWLRSMRGSPPFPKKETEPCIGDGIHWVALLEGVHEDELILVTNDLDFASKKDTVSIHPFLRSEWKTQKDGPLLFFIKSSNLYSNT